MATKMTREEAIKIVQSATVWTDEERDALAMLIPELAESEDERIRKELIEFIKWSVERLFMREDYHQAKRPSEWIAYLEKQKEQKPADLSEMMVHKEPYIAPVPTPMVADEQKPEWSEEDGIL